MYAIRKTSFVLAALIVFGLSTARESVAGPITIDFENFGDGVSLTNQLTGLTFSNSVILTAGQSLNEGELPPYSGINVLSDIGGPLTIHLAAPVLSFSGYFTYGVQITVAAYDSSNTFLGSVMSAFDNNFLLSGDPGSTPNEFLSLSFAGGISHLVITGAANGESFTLDDMTIETTAAIPEPSSLSLLLLGAIGLVRRRRKKFSTSRRL